MQRFQKAVAMLLCMVMLIGFMPVSAFAAETAAGLNEAPVDALLQEQYPAEQAEDAIYVLAGSDFQAESHATGAENVKNILNQIQKDYPTMDGFLFAGDYDQNSGYFSDSKTGKTQLQAAVQSVYGTGMHEIYVQGNHEKDSLVGTTCTTGGAHDDEGYGVYVINEKDYMWYNDNESTIKKTAQALDSYLDAKVEEKYDEPIFVVSHLPLHYSMRTVHDGDYRGNGDAMHANHIFNVLNEAGEAGLNIIFLFGHNHSHGWDDYLGGAAIYLAKGDKINIAQNSTTIYKEETLNFTYMNAGYVGYYGDTGSGVDQTLTMSVFEITDDEVTVSRYDANGVHDLKSEGFYGGEKADNDYANPVYAENKDVYETTQTIELSSFEQEMPEEPVVPEDPNAVKTLTDATGVSVTAPGATALNVTVVEDGEVSEAVAGLLEGELVAYDITVDGFENDSGTAIVSFPIPAGMDAELFAVYHVDGEAEKMEGQVEDGAYVFETDHFSTYVGGEIAVAAEEGAIAEGTLEGNTLVQIMSTSELKTNEGYLIVPNGGTTTLTESLQLSGSLDISNTNLWYKDSSNRLRFGSANATNKYLKLTSTSWGFLGTTYSASVGNSTDAANEITGSNGVFEIKRGSIYLNHSSTSAGATNSSGNSTKWNFYKIVSGTGSAAKLTVNPASVSVQPGMSMQLAADVLVDGMAASSYKLTFSSDSNNVTVSSTGVITGVRDGSANITVTLTEANGKKTNGIIQVQIPVTVKTRDFVILGVTPSQGDVVRGSVESTATGSVLTLQYSDNGETVTVPVTLGMLSKDYDINRVGVYENLTVSYGGKTIGGYTLAVLNPAVNNYPEYPRQGAVKVNKTGTGIDFQSSGIAQVEISATGLPAGKGVDVVIVIDTSSSMEKDIDGQTPGRNEKSRIQILSESLKSVLEDFQNADPVTGIVPDVEIAIIDFNGYGPSNNSYNYIMNASLNGTYRKEADNAKVYTGNTAGSAANSNNLSAASFVKSTTINATTMANNFNANNCHSGTNYDGALHDTYELLKEKQAANKAAGVEREQFVIFLSDGAPFRYNGFNTEYQGYDNWTKWLSGDWRTVDEVNAVSSNDTYTYFYNGNGTNHPHRVAEAIKGSHDQTFTVVGDRTTGSPYTMEFEGLDTKIYAIGFGLADDKSSYNNGGTVTKAVQQELIRTISSGEGYYNDDVTSADELDAAFKRVTAEISFAATNARFVDQMGENYDLQIGDHVYASTGSQVEDQTIHPTIEILAYDIYTVGETIPAGKQIGDRKGTYTTLETVTFNAAGTEAYSDRIGEGVNILIDGVICAQNFWYNTTNAPVEINGVEIPTGVNSNGTTYGSSNLLPAETFYWKMGTINTTELAMRYYVYLEESLEGGRPAGSYPTNEYATLYYDNYLDAPCHKETVSPVLPWKDANVSYAFYLVNSRGEIIVNQSTGETGTFANKVAVTNPVMYKSVNLNNQGGVSSIEVESLDVLPEGYTLYDETASYTVYVNSNSTGSWSINQNSNKVDSTYVTQFNGDAYSNQEEMADNTNDYTHTVVWFAVLWEIQALPDTVVIDYGLPVDISVLTNDMFGENGRLAGVGANSDDLKLNGYDYILDREAFGSSFDAKYGTATINAETGKIRYQVADMEMDGYDKFAYAVNYTGTANRGFYYDTVTVIPATTIYFEDDFVTYEDLEWKQLEGGQYWQGEWAVVKSDRLENWTRVSEDGAAADAVQAEDRPGRYSLTDANNIYGHDAAYANMTTYSLGSAMKATVRYDHAAQARFTFYGTGFDIISLTDSTTGLILMDVYRLNGDGSRTLARSSSVDTYYGYMHTDCHVVYSYRDTDPSEEVEKCEWFMSDVLHVKENCTDYCAGLIGTETLPETAEEGTELHRVTDAWIVDPEAEGAIWQVPVMEVEGLTYGRYEVVIQAVYDSFFDHKDGSDDGDYDFYLDAIRIYDPANDGASDGAEDTTIEDAYVADGEGWPSYIELRNNLIKKDNLGYEENGIEIIGAVFVDGDPLVDSERIADYVNYGPNNEVYLAANQSIAFMVSAPANLANIHIGISSADGNAAEYSIYNIARADDPVTGIEHGDKYNEKTNTVSTATDMYYDLTGWRNDIIVITNTGDSGIISLTNIKSTYTTDPKQQNSGASTYSLRAAAVEPELTYVYMTVEAAALVLQELNRDVIEEIPEETVPEETEPEETVPETTVPEETEPEAFQPKLFQVSVNKDTVKVGQKVQVTVTTSSDVDHVTVNGKVITQKGNDKKGVRTWKLNVTAERAGIMNLNVVCYNAADEASEAVNRQIRVQNKNGLEVIFDLIIDLIFDFFD